jgi:hypothetical protein
MRLSKITLSILVSTLLSACVSLNLGNTEAKKSKSATLVAPVSPFSEIKSEMADQIWISGKTGNTISYYTSCNDPADKTLAGLRAEVLTLLSQPKIVDEAELTFNDRPALRSTILGKVEGVDVFIETIIFSKNGCHYTLTYSGLPKNQNIEKDRFANFTNEFRVK